MSPAEGFVAVAAGLAALLAARYAADQDEMGWSMMLGFFGFVTVAIGLATMFFGGW